jgi:exodeoxyribonuclease VII large subunit
MSSENLPFKPFNNDQSALSIPKTTSHFDSALTVSELNRQVKRMLEVSYAQVWVKGELSGLSKPRSGHWYFNLKDDKAQIRCAIFKGFNQKLKFKPKEGDLILARAKVSLYEGRGDYQLIVESMEPAGLGQLQAAFEALKLKLSQEGLFNSAHKKSIPNMPKKVVVITSASGAVIHDIISVSQRRFPLMEIILIPVSVQGEKAASEIANAIQFANRHKLAEVMVVGRGGGSLEDLWSFNEEVVARAIFNSEIPIISAVGHEVDFTIADLVADYRAPTPSAAAEKITPDQFELMQQLDLDERRLSYLFSHKLKQCQERLTNQSKRLKHPREALEDKKQKLVQFRQRINQVVQHKLKLATQQLETQRLSLRQLSPKTKIEHHKQTINIQLERIFSLQNMQLKKLEHQLGLLAQTLHTASPLATLGRGYAIIKKGSDSQTNSSKVITSSKKVKAGDKITATLKDGSIHCTVDRSIPELDL